MTTDKESDGFAKTPHRFIFSLYNDAISKIEKYQNDIKGNSSYFDELAISIKKNDAKAMGILLY